MYNVVVPYYVEAATCFFLCDVTYTHIPINTSDACRQQSVISINIRKSSSPLSWLRGEGVGILCGEGVGVLGSDSINIRSAEN